MPDRREFLLAASAAAAAAAETAVVETDAVQRNDRAVDSYLSSQNTDPKSRWFGGFPDASGLHHGGSAMGIFDYMSASFVHPASKHHRNNAVFECLKRAAEFLDRHMTPDGNVNLLITNFNSAPDTAFGARGMAMGAWVAKAKGERALLDLIRPRLERAGRGLASGGVHTPNHRWIVCASMVQIHELFPDPAYPKRIAQWLAEGIDIDEDGQFTERSSGVYNMVVDSSLLFLADKLNRPDLLEPIRRNLDAVIHLMHAGGELVTGISSRQDRGARSNIAPYFLPLQYLAARDGNKVYAGLARQHRKDYLQLSYLMMWPQLGRTDLPTEPAPSRYTRRFERMGVTRIRRDAESATIFAKGESRFFEFRNGNAVVEWVRFASGFFGKGQFRAEESRVADGVHTLTQRLTGPYYQPVDHAVGMDFQSVRRERRQTQVCTLTQTARIEPRDGSFDLTIEAAGTEEVPITVEIALREGGSIDGVETAKEAPEAYYLKQGDALFRREGDAIRFGPGRHEHRWIVVRGGESKGSGPAVYLTGFTPFRHTISFRRA